MMSDREAFDTFLGDMAGHQADHVGEVTGKANQRLAAPVFERLDQQEAERKPAPPTPAEPVRQSDIEAKKRGFVFQRDLPEPSGPPMVALLTPKQRALKNALDRRVTILLNAREPGILGAPSWRDRYLAILAEKMANPASAIVANVAGAKMLALCQESEAVFGPLFGAPARRIYVG